MAIKRRTSLCEKLEIGTIINFKCYLFLQKINFMED